MNHKSIIRMFTGVFCFSLFLTIIQFKSVSVFNETFFSAVFAALIVTCIWGFKNSRWSNLLKNL